jgi:hypothetical protein
MRPREIKTTGRAIENIGKKRDPSSATADPPISEAETLAAPVSICRWHDGLIRLAGAKDGAVFFCATGGQYWNWQKPDQRFWRSLKVVRRGIV